MPILGAGSNSSISESATHVRFKRRDLSAVVPPCLTSANLLMCVVAWDDTHGRFPAGVYSVIGVDRDANAIAKARELAGGPSYVHADIREYRPEPGTLDVVIVMSQSFGYFDPATNRNVLARLAVGLREGGRVILDLWNHEFFAAHQGERELKTAHGVVQESKRLNGDRLYVQLDYPDGAHEEFKWQLFTPAQMTSLAQSVGLGLLLSCTDFDTTIAPSPAKPRIATTATVFPLSPY